MRIEATFVRSAADAGDVPSDGLPQVALVGRSNVGKSSLINALLRQRLARASAAPGKTRLANVYRVARGTAPPFYLVDLPGFGYARGGAASAREFATLTAGFFGHAGQVGRVGRVRQVGELGSSLPALPAPSARIAALLLVDARHPGLDNDRAAWRWLSETVATRAIIATKIDKLARGQRIRALAELESVFEHPVTAVSAVTGEGLNELWKLIARMTMSA